MCLNMYRLNLVNYGWNRVRTAGAGKFQIKHMHFTDGFGGRKLKFFNLAKFLLNLKVMLNEPIFKVDFWSRFLKLRLK